MGGSSTRGPTHADAPGLGLFETTMPQAAPKPCTHPGCGVLVRDGTSRCLAHKVLPGSFADKRRGTRHERGYGSAWDKTRGRILDRDAGLCQPCLRAGRVTRATSVDHRLAKAFGGTDADANLESICPACRRAKDAADAAAGRAGRFARYREGGG